MGIGNLGFSEILLITVIVLVFFGPRRIPEVARSVGRTLRELKRGLNEVKREFEELERAGDREEEGNGDAGRPTGRVEPPEEGAPEGSREEADPRHPP